MKYLVLFITIVALSLAVTSFTAAGQTIPEPVSAYHQYLPINMYSPQLPSQIQFPTPIPTAIQMPVFQFPTNTPVPTLLPTSTPIPVILFSCEADEYNCSDFDYQYEAQHVFDTCWPINGDIHKLDRDKDGHACDSLP